MNKFTELTVVTTHEGSELVSDILSEYSSEGVAVNDIEDVIDLEQKGKTWDYADEAVYSADKAVTVKAFLKDDEKNKAEKIKKRLAALKENSPFNVGSLEISLREIDGDEWRERWKERYKPIHIGKTVIVPEWIDYNEEKDEIKVLIGSNMAFGTGEHETTSMCVEYLCEYAPEADTVIDVGCGSGILGIAAAKLGAKKVIMTDIDECAITATEQNMRINGVTNGEASLRNLLDDESVSGDVIVCNIMAETLISFAPHIGKNLNPNGVIILSGILADRLEKVKAAYSAAGFTFVSQKIIGEWSACVFKRARV